MATIEVDEEGEPVIPNETVIGKAQDLFGPKIYETIVDEVLPQVDSIGTSSAPSEAGKAAKGVADVLKKRIKETVITPAADDYGMKAGAQKRLERQVETDIDRKFERVAGEDILCFQFFQQLKITGREGRRDFQ